MNRTKYLAYLRSKGYKIVNENQATLGSLTFDIQ